MSNNRYYSINQNNNNASGYCNKLHIDSGICGGSSSYSSPNGYERVSYHDSGNNYTGYGGVQCSIADIQRADNVVQAFEDDVGVIGNQIFALFSVLFGDVKFQCSSDNIQGKCDQIGKQINSLYSKNEKNKTQLRKMAGILQYKEGKGELKSEGEKFVLKYLKEHYSFPGNPDPLNYSKTSDFPQNGISIYYRYLKAPPYRILHPGWAVVPSNKIWGTDNVLKDIPDGFIKEGWGYIKLDWSNELKKYNELLTPKPQSIYRVGGLTFFSEQSAKNYVDATRHARPCDVNRTDSQFVM